MATGLLGRKVGMTQIFDQTGQAVPVTVLQAGPCHVLQIKTEARDGYEAVQLGYLDKPRRLASRSARGHVAKLDSKRQKRRAAAGVESVAQARLRTADVSFASSASSPKVCEVGQEVKVDIFAEVKAVDVVGITKGRGFTGVMKRHNFAGQRASHGVKKCHRHCGSIGRNTDPGHVDKGRKMAGHYGNERCTIRNLKVARVDVENNLLLVHGAVPGPNGGYVVIRSTNKL